MNETAPPFHPPDCTTPQHETGELRKLPAVDSLLRRAEISPLVAEFGTGPVTAAARAELDAARDAIRAGAVAPTWEHITERISHNLLAVETPSLRPVINATGVLIHTNLGRAPLSQAAQKAVIELAKGYSTLEYDLEAGGRGSRHRHPARLLSKLTGAEDALVVNNNASAVFLALSAMCQGREVIVSRGELVEIGGGFRIPDVLRQSGATLVEVGTTNRTHPHDFANAISPRTAALMRIHASNFRQLGFVKKPELNQLVAIAHAHRAEESPDTPPAADPVQIPGTADRATAERTPAGRPRPEWPIVIDDLGSGTLLDTARFGLAAEPMVQASVQAGADIITFSGDKLLGGPQAGLIVGKSKCISRLRAHPLARALRVDKMTLAALDATLRAYRSGRAATEIPVWRMIDQPAEAVRRRAQRLQKQLGAAGFEAAVIRGESTIGGGSLPGETLPTHLLALDTPQPDESSASLRKNDPPVICRIQNDLLLFDLRTVLPEQDTELLEALAIITTASRR